MALPTSYVFWNISFEVFCIIVTSLMLIKQLTVFNKSLPEKALTVVMFIQLAYFTSFIPRVLIDAEIMPKTQLTVYAVTLINIALFIYCSYRVFIYLELYLGLEGFRLWKNKFIYAVPCLFNFIVLMSCPVTGAFLSVSKDAVTSSGPLWRLMIIINCFYPAAGLLTYLFRVKKAKLTHADMKVTIAFPLFFAIFGPLSALQWRIPILPFGLILADIFVYISYTDQLMRERNEKLRLEKELALAQNRAKSEFLSNMSHDIRTPMNAIVGYTNLALTDVDDRAKTTEHLKKIKASSDHLLSLINDILEMSRIESGRIELIETPCSLISIFDELQDLFLPQVKDKQQTLTVDTSGVTDKTVCCDKLRLNQILMNLMSNAVKYTPAGGNISVRLSQKPGAPEGCGDYEISVKDNGIGMSEEFAERIFDAFERERTSTISGIQGTGLGMAIAKRIVDLMGGTITVHSKQGEGTEFLLSLRMKLSETVQQEDKEHTELTTDFSGKRVLLVDDIEINREIAAMILSTHGLTVEKAVNGAEAVEKVRSSEPGYYHAVLMDIQMPVMDGYQAAREIRALENPQLAAIPIVAMTANAFEEDRRMAFESGMNGHVAKPIDDTQLTSTLQSVLL